MAELELDQLVLRYCRQVIMLAMDHVRSRMREENLPALRRCVDRPNVRKSDLNLTKAIDQEAEDLIVQTLRPKFAKLPIQAYTVFSEELGIQTIHAHSPQAKGRVERVIQTLQDRLPKQMRLRGIASRTADNTFLPEFTQDFNRRFGEDTLRRITGLIQLSFNVLNGLISLRFLLKLMAANPANPFASLVYFTTSPFLWIFQGLTRIPPLRESRSNSFP